MHATQATDASKNNLYPSGFPTCTELSTKHIPTVLSDRQEGVRGLWRGATPAVQRAALVNLGELATYDHAKESILRTGLVGDNVAAHTLSSMCSGLFASLISTPADVIKTRMMNQDPAAPLYRGSVDCLVQSVRAEGVLALYKGFLPTWARLGPWQLVFWVSYEQLRRAADLGSF